MTPSRPVERVLDLSASSTAWSPRPVPPPRAVPQRRAAPRHQRRLAREGPGVYRVGGGPRTWLGRALAATPPPGPDAHAVVRQRGPPVGPGGVRAAGPHRGDRGAAAAAPPPRWWSTRRGRSTSSAPPGASGSPSPARPAPSSTGRRGPRRPEVLRHWTRSGASAAAGPSWGGAARSTPARDARHRRCRAAMDKRYGRSVPHRVRPAVPAGLGRRARTGVRAPRTAGGHGYRLDAAYVDRRVAVELDGRGHLTEAAYAADRAFRDNGAPSWTAGSSCASPGTAWRPPPTRSSPTSAGRWRSADPFGVRSCRKTTRTNAGKRSAPRTPRGRHIGGAALLRPDACCSATTCRRGRTRSSSGTTWRPPGHLRAARSAPAGARSPTGHDPRRHPRRGWAHPASAPIVRDDPAGLAEQRRPANQRCRTHVHVRPPRGRRGRYGVEPPTPTPTATQLPDRVAHDGVVDAP